MQCANKVGAVDQTAAAIRRLNKHDIGREADTLEIEPQLSPDYRGHAGGRRGDAGARQGRKEVRVGVRAGPMLSSLTIHCHAHSRVIHTICCDFSVSCVRIK